MIHLNVPRLALLAAVALCMGCASQNKGKIEGTSWSCWASTVKGVSVPAGGLQLEFGANGKLTYKTPFQTFTGTYSLGMGDYVSFNLDQDLAGRKNHLEHVTISGNQMIMRDGDGTQVTFDKVK